LIAHRSYRNISSSSKLQRAPEVPLQPNTVQTLIEAQEAVRKSRLLLVQAVKSDDFVQVHVEEKSREIRSNDAMNDPAMLQMYRNSIFMFQQISNVGSFVSTSRPVTGPPRSLRFASSSDRLTSAVDEQEPDVEIIREVEGALHALRTALEVLEKVMKRIDEEDKALRIEADMLNYSLIKGLNINQAHRSHHKMHGVAYLRAFRDSQITIRQLQDIMAKLMRELVTTLHMYSAAYEVLSLAGFQKLFSYSESVE
jgi:rubrerythrin